uniref:Uncharacterized protein n=1 Tax=Arundo donax TaxID=35708 RepID=A0A0A9EVH4_ARUDO
MSITTAATGHVKPETAALMWGTYSCTLREMNSSGPE